MSRDVDKTELITRKVVDLLNVVLDSEHTQDFEYAFKTGKTWFQTEDGQHFFGLDIDGTKRYEQVAYDILQMEPWDRLSLKYVKNKMNEIYEKSLSAIVEGEGSGILPKALSKADIDDVREQVRSLVADLDLQASQEWIVYLPLAGIEAISGDSLKIGPACLKYMNSTEMGALNGKIDLILQEPTQGDKGGAAQRDFIRGRSSTLKDTVCAIYHVTAEPDRAIEIAEEQTQEVLDLLTFYLSFIHSRDYKGAVRLQGEMSGGHRTTLLLSSAADRLYQANQRTGIYMPVTFTTEDIERMRTLGILDVSTITESDPSEKFRKTVLTGIRFFAESQRQDAPEIEFVNLVNCLENCLTPYGSESAIRASIAEGCAILLTSELEQRLQLRKKVLDIYSVRSKIVHHGGSITKTSDKSHLAELRMIARDLLAVLIERINEFKVKQELLTWILEQKLML
jgi:hypothetical protein